MPIAPPTFDELGDIYQQLNDEINTLQDAALAVASPAARQVLCSVGGALSLGFGRLGRISSPGFADLGQGVGGLLERACEFPPPPPEEPSPPFDGGQCECVLYAVNITFERPNRPPNIFTENRPGPIGEMVRRPVPTQGQPDRTELGFFFGGPDCGGRQFRLLASFNADDEGSDAFRGTINSATRLDGLPDNCGSLPPPPLPDRPPIVQPPPSPPIPRVDPDGNPLPDLIFAPRVGPVYVDVDGSLNIPVDVNISGPDIDLNIPVSVNLGDFSPTIIGVGGGGGSGPGQEPGPPPQICCPGPPPRTRDGGEEDPDEEPEDPPKDMAIAAVIVSSATTGDGRNNSTIFTAAPPLLVPRIGTVQFEVEVEGQRFIGPDIQLKQTRQLVEAPTTAKVTRAFVRWEPGWSGGFQYLERAINEPFPTIAEE